jgi:hypothetical protein
MIVICCICDSKIEVPEDATSTVCEYCLTDLSVYEDGSTDVM